jgi:enterochelin esterase-like enzyme
MYKSPLTLACFFLCLFGLVLSACGPTEADSTPAVPPAAPSATPAALPAASATVAPTASPSPVASSTALPCAPVSLESGTVGVGVLDKPMDYHVLLPPCYAERSRHTYPVLYLLHGQNSDQEQWLRLGLAEAAERLMGEGEIPPFVIVLPFDHSPKQPREYPFEQVFLEELIPKIGQDYRVRDSRESRAIGGLSRGGAWAIYLASRHPDVFGLVGAHSPAVFYSNSGALPVRLRDMPVEQRPFFYVDAGDKDVDFRAIQRFTTLLNDLGFPHEWHYNLGFHDEAYWSRNLEEYLRWYGRQFEARE